MNKKQDDLLRALKEMFKVPAIIEPCTVKSVDDDNFTCVVTPLDGPEISDVRLKAGVDGVSDGLVQIPAVDSVVLVALIGNDRDNRFVIAFSAVTETLFNGGDNGGLINIETLKTELQKTNDVVNALVNSLTGWTPVPNDGGAALKAYAAGQLAGKVTGDFSSMEDETVKH